MIALDRYGFCGNGVLSFVTGRAENSASALWNLPGGPNRLKPQRASQSNAGDEIVAEEQLLIGCRLRMTKQCALNSH